MEITLEVNRRQVLDEIAQTTSYTGAKMGDDKEAYKRIFTKDEDASALARFWDETRAAFCETMKGMLNGESCDDSGSLRISLRLSNSFDTALKPSMEKELFSYFVTSITGRWYRYCNKAEAGDYLANAVGLLEGIKRKACFKKKPTRPVY